VAAHVVSVTRGRGVEHGLGDALEDAARDVAHRERGTGPCGVGEGRVADGDDESGRPSRCSRENSPHPMAVPMAISRRTASSRGAPSAVSAEPPPARPAATRCSAAAVAESLHERLLERDEGLRADEQVARLTVEEPPRVVGEAPSRPHSAARARPSAAILLRRRWRRQGAAGRPGDIQTPAVDRRIELAQPSASLRVCKVETLQGGRATLERE